MAVRRERVILDLEGNFGRNAAEYTAAALALDAAIGRLGDHGDVAGDLDVIDSKVTRLGKSSRQASGEVDEAEQAVGRLGDRTRNDGRDIDRYSGRLALLAQAAVTLGPALIPLGAVGLAGIAGMTADLGAATGAIGVAVLAFHGLGDAMKAVNDFEVAPTTENLAKMQQQLEAIGPAGAHLVMYLDSLQPLLKDVQNVARDGIFPGVEDGLDAALTRFPQARAIIASLSNEIGDLFDQTGQAIANGDLDTFLGYLETDGAPTLDALGKAAGNVAVGLGNMLSAVSPLSRDFNGFLVDSSRDFEKWSSELGDSQGLHDFIDYAENNGPKVAHTMGAVGDALLQVVEAAAPLGGPVLDVLTDVANVVSAVADSPIGTPLFTMAAGLSAIARAQKLLSAAGGLSLTSSLLGGGLLGAGSSTTGNTMAGGTIRSQLADIKALPAAYRESADAQAELARRQADYRTAAAEYSGTLQAQNTLMSQGYSRSAEAEHRLADGLGKVEVANHGVTEATERVSAAEARRSGLIRSSLGTLGKTAGVTAGLAVATSGLADSTGLSHTASLALVGTMAGPYGAAIGGAVGFTMDLYDANQKAADAQEQLNAVMRSSPADFNAQAQAIDALRAKAQDYRDDTEQHGYSGFLKSRLDPDTYIDSARNLLGKDSIDKQMDDQAEKAEQTAVRIQHAVASISTGLGNRTTAGSFLTTLLGQPGDLNALSAAATNLQPALSALGISMSDLGKMTPAQLAATTKAIGDYQSQADSAQGRNQALASAFADLDNQMISTADSASDVAKALNAALGPGLNLSAATDAWTASLHSLDTDLAKTSKTLRGNSDAALQNRSAIRDRVSAMTQVLSAEADAGASTSDLTKHLRNQRGALLDAGAAAGISRGQMRTYLNTLGLTPALVQTLVQAQTGQAEGALKSVKAHVADVDRARATAHITANVGQAEAAIHAVRSLLGALDGTVARTSVVTTHVVHNIGSTGNPQAKPGASGMTVPGPRFPYGDKVYAYLAPGEEVITNRNGEADQFRADRAAGRIPAYADGTGKNSGAKRDAGRGNIFLFDSTAQQLQQLGGMFEVGTRNLTSELKQLTKSLDRQVKVQQKALDKQQKVDDAAHSNSLKTGVDDLKATRDGLASSIADTFGLSDIFAPSPASANPWAAGATAAGVIDPTSRLDAITAAASQFTTDVTTLTGDGVTGPALQAIMAQGPTVTHQLAQLPASALSGYASAYGNATSAITKASTYGANATGLEDQIKAAQAIADIQDAKLEKMHDRLKEIRDAVKQADRANTQAHDTAADKVGGHINGAAVKGHKDKPRHKSGFGR